MSQMGYNKSRVIGGKVLKYRSSAPVSGSFRSRQAAVGELKNVDLSSTTSLGTVATGVQYGLLNGIATGADTNQRIGRRVTMKSLWVRWNYTMAPTSTGSSPFRVLVVYDKQSNGGSQPTNLNVLSADNINGMKNLAYEKRFQTVMDEYVPCIGTGGPQSAIGQRFIKLNHDVEFSGTGGTSAEVFTGALWLTIWQNGSILTAGPLVNIQTRVRYCD